MTDETRVAQVTDKVLALSRALAGHRGPLDTTTTPGLVTVYDGPEIFATDDKLDDTFVVIGWSGTDVESLQPSAVISLAAGPIASSNRPRDEITTINCLVSATRKETAKDARDAAIGEVKAFAQLLRSDPSLGLDTSGTIGGVRTIAYVTAGDMTQYLDKGYVADMLFTITYKARV